MAWNDLPYVECPHCGYDNWIDDYGDVDIDDEFECVKCEKAFYVNEIERVIKVSVRKVAQKKSE